MYQMEQLKYLPVPYKDVEVFVQEKYKIAGEKLGSGNTENIGSFKTKNIQHLINGEGPFSVLGMEIYEEYWSGYPKYRATSKDYTSLEEYFRWGQRKGKEVNKLRRMYQYWKKMHKDE